MLMNTTGVLLCYREFSEESKFTEINPIESKDFVSKVKVILTLCYRIAK